ncbi:hypothetical protein [Streptomyces sp. NPDC059819]|uniref:hypothetical protein n=1 Tax=Streptomyces sp. NPDC059819 TaxID=3346963 RepID=UPI00365C5E36
MRGFRARYGGSPLHLSLVLCSFALAGYAGIRLLRGDTLMVLVWFIGAALLHDLVLLPLYTLIDRAAQRVLTPRTEPAGDADRRSPARLGINYVRVPAFLSGVLLLTYFPLILGQVHGFTTDTSLPDNVFLGRWLLVTAALFAVSALVLLARMVFSRRARRTPGPTQGSAPGGPKPTPGRPEHTPGPETGSGPGTIPGPAPSPGPESAP